MDAYRFLELRRRFELGQLSEFEGELFDYIVELRQAMWEVDAILGFDHDGDATPDAMVYPPLTIACVRNARELRRDIDELDMEVRLPEVTS